MKSDTQTAPKGTIIDGASIPKALHTHIGHPMTGCYVRAACIHDHHYGTHHIDRKRADQIFEAGLIECGVTKMDAALMYSMLRACGGPAWKSGMERARK